MRLCLAACILFLLTSVDAQTTIKSQVAPLPKIELRNVVFENATLLSREELTQISKELHEQDSKYSREIDDRTSGDFSGFAEQAAELVRSAYQDKGYFNPDVQFKVNPVSVDSAVRQMDIVVNVVEQGQMYRMGSIRWENMTVFSKQQLQDLMPIHPGEIFSRAKIAEGLENASKLYGSRGYINMTQIPNTKIDEAKATIALDIDVDEGGKFTLRGVAFSGLTSDQLRDALVSIAPFRGQPYTRDLSNEISQQLYRILPTCANLDQGQQVHINENTHLVDIFFDFEECTDQWFQSQIQPN
jgi:outer membrane protein assembly factor BamA